MKGNKKGFTLIEILAAIAILGILSTIAVISVNKIIQQGKNKHYTTAENNLKLAGQSYVQDNRSELPKVIGQKTKVYLNTLEDKNYINEILDYSDNKCYSDKSYVQIYKYSQDDYSYLAYLECPDYKSDLDTVKENLSVEIKFSGTEEANAEATIIMKDDYKLASYSYTIYKGTKEVKNSGNVAVTNFAKEVTKKVSLSSYTPGKIKVVAVATNIYGKTYTAAVEYSYEDKINPICEYIDSADDPNNPKEWTNTGTRKITVACKDGDGSGCTRETFTKTFKNTTKIGTITLSDEAGNTYDCPVSVYIDKTKPTITINVYKRNKSGKKTGSVIATETVNDTTPTATLDLSKLSSTKWLNNADYPYGVYYEVEFSDGLALGNYTIKQNSAGLSTSTVAAATTTIINKTSTGKSNTATFSTSEDGYRTYVISASDDAGNSVTLNVIAPLDRQSPNTPTVNLYKWTNNSTTPSSSTNLSAYQSDTWSKLNVYTTASSSTDSISGFKTYEYTTTGTTTQNTDTATSTASRSIKSEGTSTIKYRACDNAGNCSSYSTTYTIKIDKTNPVCTVSGGNTDWTNGSRTITAKCSDSGSGCATNDFSKVYDAEISTTTAGANGNNSGGVVYDNAGNSTNCAANQTVRIDQTAPTCTVSGGSTDWTNGSRTITAKCTDTGGSGCVTNSDLSKKYSSNINTTTAGANGDGKGGSVSDNAGNTTSCSANQTVKIDTTPPTCTTSGGSSSWTNSDVTLTGTCSDTGGSGCSGNSSNKYSSNTNTTTANPGKVYDNAGNSGTCPNTTVKIDKTKPTCTVSGGNSSWTNGSRTITAKCTDTGGSGCVTNSDFSKKYSSNINTTTAGANGNGDGGSVSDNAGNTTSCSANQTVKIDKTDPTISSINNPSNGNATAPGLVLTLNGYDSGGSGMSHWRYSYNGTSWTNYSSSNYSGYKTTPFTAERDQTVYIGLCDVAGNCVSSSTHVHIVEEEEEEVSDLPANNCNIRGSSKKTQSYTWDCTCGRTHSTGYTHYCTDSNGNLQTRSTNKTLVKFSWVCPISPYGEAQGWIVIDD